MRRMNILALRRGLALLCVLLSACATSSAAVRECDEAPEAVHSWEEAREDPSCVVPKCDVERCAVWRCDDLVEVEEPPRVLLAQITLPAVETVPETMVAPLPGPGNNPSRWWGRPLAAPMGAEPVFEIPWHNWNAREQHAPKVLRPPCIRSWEPIEKHHIFPQELAIWFGRQKLDIHAYTLRLPRSFHRWLHSGGPRGGRWNEEWRQFQMKNDTANKDEMWQFAFELMSRFRVHELPFVPYYCD
jgi:uncharacterized lipoprotein (TIGR02269 family)